MIFIYLNLQTIEVPYYPTIGFKVSQMNKDIKYDAYLCRTKTTTKQPIFIVDWSTQHNADQLKPGWILKTMFFY